MYVFIYFSIIFCSAHGEDLKDNLVKDVSVYGIADHLIVFLGINSTNNSTRIKDLKDKLSKIDSYVVDKDKYAELLHNKSKQTNLNETNFYKALNDQDHFLVMNESKNLYLKLKQNMNRDDVMGILSEKAHQSKVIKSARKMIDHNIVSKKLNDRLLNDAVDKYLGETAVDNHKFSEKDKYSKYWDPQVELEEKKAHLEPSRRIYKGERTTVRYYPFMVSIHVMGRFWCGGVLYWHDLAVTSASCLQLMHNNRFFRENPKALAVRIGSNHSRVGGEMIDALEVYFHPAYNPRTLVNNLALIRLRRHIKLSYHRIPKIIEIAKDTEGMPYTAEVLLLGWGVTKTSQKLRFEPIFLQRKLLPIYPNTFCEEVYGKKFITRTMFCAGTLTTGEGACDHDAGGPAIMNGRLVGIISFGPTICGFPDAPTVFTLVGAYTEWFDIVNDTMPRYYMGKKRTTLSTPDPFLEYFQTASTNMKLKTVFIDAKSLLEKEAGAKGETEATKTEETTLPSFRAHKEKKHKRSKHKTTDFVITPRVTSSYPINV